MSIVAVHGPNTMFGTGAGGGGTGPVIENAGGTVTADMTNGMKFTLLGKGDRAAADYDWTFSDGTAAINNNKGPNVVTFATPGAKVVTLTLGTSAGTTPAGGTYTYNITADTSPVVQVEENDGGTVTGDQYNGALFNLVGKGDRAAIDYDWSFSDGTTAIPNLKTTSVTFTTGGLKTITLTVGSSAGTTPPASPPPYIFQVTATVGVVPRSLIGGNGGDGGSYDPGDHTVAEVQDYVNANPDEAGVVYDAELEGKARSTLVTWLEEQIPYDPADYTVAEVQEYAEDNPDQLADIIAAERAGKNRSTLIERLEAL